MGRNIKLRDHGPGGCGPKLTPYCKITRAKRVEGETQAIELSSNPVQHTHTHQNKLIYWEFGKKSRRQLS
jgi:hypothetical protein